VRNAGLNTANDVGKVLNDVARVKIYPWELIHDPSEAKTYPWELIHHPPEAKIYTWELIHYPPDAVNDPSEAEKCWCHASIKLAPCLL